MGLSSEPFDAEALKLEYLHLLARYRLSVQRPYEGSPAMKGKDSIRRGGGQWEF
jgi:hypothetical protein